MPRKPLHQTTTRHLTTYWPHAGIVVGLLLTLLGPIVGDEKLIASGANLLTVSAVFLMQRARDGK